jgi:hypothetical protein
VLTDVTDHIMFVSGVGSHPVRLAVETQLVDSQIMLKTLLALCDLLVDKPCKLSIFDIVFSFICSLKFRDTWNPAKPVPLEFLLWHTQTGTFRNARCQLTSSSFNRALVKQCLDQIRSINRGQIPPLNPCSAAERERRP